MRRYTFPILGREYPGHFCEDSADLKRFTQWVYRQAQAGEPVAFDSESTGLDIYTYGPKYLRLAQFGTADTAWLIPVEYGRAFRGSAADALRILPDITGHNLFGFDLHVADVHLGVPIEELAPKCTDTMFLAKLLDPRGPQDGGIGAGLKELSRHYIDPDAADTAGDLTAEFRKLGLTKATGWAGISLTHPVYCSYSAGDVLLTSRLRVALEARMREVGVRRDLVPYEHEIGRMTAIMTRTAMLVDQEYTERQHEIFADEQEKYEGEAARYGVSNVNAPAQLREAFAAMGEEWGADERTKTGALKVDAAVLHRFADLDKNSGKRVNSRTPNPLAEAVLRSKRAGKWNSAYIETFLSGSAADGRVHPFINSLQARTGRMSITRPALQTLPSGDWVIRRCLLAEPGHRIISTDFASVEMRVLASLANVRRMKEAIANGLDLNDYTASLVYGPGFTKAQRKICKGVGYGTIYGGGAASIARQTGAPEDQVREAQQRYHRVYPEIRRYSRALQREAFQTGMVHVSVTGRRLPLDPQRAYAVVNYAVQSAARDVLGQSMINCEEAGLLPYLRLPIHDELLASAPASEADEVAREIERCMTWDLFGVPIKAEAEIGGRSWGSLYMKDKSGAYLPDLLIQHDEWYAAHPADAYALAV